MHWPYMPQVKVKSVKPNTFLSLHDWHTSNVYCTVCIQWTPLNQDTFLSRYVFAMFEALNKCSLQSGSMKI